MMAKPSLEDLIAYTDPRSPEYDAEFDKKIRALQPAWFDDEYRAYADLMFGASNLLARA